MNKFRFLGWGVYRDAKELFSHILEVVERLPKEYRYELGNQIVRSALSVVLNIAEGSGKSSDRELNRFIDVALGSVNETLAALDIFRDNHLIADEEFEDFYKKLDSISSQLGGFKKQINRQSLGVSHKSSVISHQSERGVSLYMTFMIMALLLGIGFGMSALLLTQLDTLRGIGYSVLAFYATEAGIDRVLYIDQKDCANDPDRVSCLHTAVDPLGTQTLGNGAQYTLTIESPGGACTASIYCVKSVGTYQQARRAVRVGR